MRRQGDTLDPTFFDRVKAILAVMVPLMLALLAYLKATNANDDAAHDEKLRQLMFSSLPTKAEVQARWTTMDERDTAIRAEIRELRQHDYEQAAKIALLEGKMGPCRAQP